jgi:DNA mismatch repair ATPase MutS
MITDKTTLDDLSIFHSDGSAAVFDKLTFTITERGKEQLRKNLSLALPSTEKIFQTQATIRKLQEVLHEWPKQISNGTIMVIDRLYETSLDPIPSNVTSISAYFYKILHGADYSLALYSANHCFDLIKGIDELIKILWKEDNPAPLKDCLTTLKKIVHETRLAEFIRYESSTDMPPAVQLELTYFIRYKFKYQMHSMLEELAKLDAWYGMAKAMKEYNLQFPEVSNNEYSFLEAKGLYHLLLSKPVTYDIKLDRNNNFLFLTGANMAGKSTFIKSIGAAVFLAHTGMGVPATSMKMSYFDGLLSNINITDNINKGESYFYNEVQRIKGTIEKISDGKKWLILIDELFKGTNVQDAMKCSQTIVEGLVKAQHSLFILSTHLYEIGASLQQFSNISFYYFETSVSENELKFYYTLKPGISEDRIGYLILEKEGVVKLLQSLT